MYFQENIVVILIGNTVKYVHTVHAYIYTVGNQNWNLFFLTSSKFSMCIEELKLLNKSKKKL